MRIEPFWDKKTPLCLPAARTDSFEVEGKKYPCPGSGQTGQAGYRTVNQAEGEANTNHFGQKRGGGGASGRRSVLWDQNGRKSTLE